MGIILSRFRRKLTSLEELEKIEEKIRDIEKYKNETEQRQKKIVGKLVVYSVGVYVLAAALFYFLFFPASLRDRLFYIIPLLVFPIIVILMKKLISWYYIRRMTEQQDLLRRLRSDKRQLLEQVKEKETYKVARTILEKFAPDQLRNNNFTLNATTANARPVTPVKSISNSFTSAIVPVRNNSLTQKPITNAALLSSGSELRLRGNRIPPEMLQPASSLLSLQPGLPRPRPVLPKETGFLDRLMESLVGDGPSFRYALICSQCHGHNGMALQEEFPFLAYRCCYCSFYNSAKKQRPLSPKLLDKENQQDTEYDSEPDSETETSENEETKNEIKDCNSIKSVEDKVSSVESEDHAQHEAEEIKPVEDVEGSQEESTKDDFERISKHLLEVDELKSD